METETKQRTRQNVLLRPWVLVRQLPATMQLGMLFVGVVIAFMGWSTIQDRRAADAATMPMQLPETVVTEPVAEPHNRPDEATPVFIVPQGGEVTLTAAMLANIGDFYHKIEPTLVFNVIPNATQSLPIAAAQNAPLVTGDCGYTFCNSVSFALFYEDRSISVTDRHGEVHTMAVTKGGWRVNWWNVSNFVANYSTENTYEIVKIYEISGDQISAELAVRPPGLLNLVVHANEGTEHNLFVIWDPANPPDFQVGPVDGALLVDALMTRTTGGDFYLPPGANCMNPEYQEIGHTSGPCPDEEIPAPDWMSEDGQAGGTFNANGEPMEIAVIAPNRAPDNQLP